jgi:2-aminoadipate transaminase
MKSPSLKFAKRTKRMSASVIREILKVSSRPNVISFAGGLPAPETFPLKQFEEAIQETLRVDGPRSLQYTLTEGLFGLKEYLCQWLTHQGIEASPEQMLLTHGSQQALDLLGRIFLNPGDSILVEDPSYLGAIQCFNTYEAKYVTVPIDDHGLDPDKVAVALKKTNPRFIYTVPTFQNPSGTTMPLERREKLLEVARAKNLPIIEDDPYSLLRFKGSPVRSIYSLAKGRGVVFMSTFSKLLSPGIRLGFVLAQPEVIQQLVFAKQATDLQTNTFIQYAVYHYCKRGYLEKHIPSIIKDYAHRAEVMMDSINRHFPADVHVVQPDGGMFVWCTLPKKLKASVVFKKSLEQGVAFVDGSVFFANGGGENTMRLNFTNSTDETIRTGIERLGGVIKSLISKPQPASVR